MTAKTSRRPLQSVVVHSLREWSQKRSSAFHPLLRACFRILIVAGCGFAAQHPAAAQQLASSADSGLDWPQFLGPDRNGISAETGLLDRFPQEGPPEVWRKKVGGMSGLAISRGRIVTMTQANRKQWLVAMDAATGEEVWKTEIGPQYKNAMGDGPRGTPAIDGERVFAFSGEGILTAVNFDDGEILWSHDTVAELGGEPAEYGMACSPLVVDNRVVVMVGAPQATVAAYDVRSGRQAWTAGEDAAGYSSPALLNVGGREQIVVSAGSAVLGLTPQTGEVLWRHPFETDFNCNIATPVAWEGKVFISSGENHGCALLELTPRNTGYKVEEVWASLGPKSVMRNEWQTSVLLDGRLYGLDNVGGAGPVTHLNCVDIATGEQLWQEERFGKGNLIAADGNLWIATMEGELVLVRPSPDGYEELGRAAILGPTRQAPALAGGLMYLRDNEQIVCLDVRK